MNDNIELEVTASLLRCGRSLDQLSTGLTLLGVLYGLGQLLLTATTPLGLLLSVWLIVLGVWQKYWALRVAFDADLFALVASGPEGLAERTRVLDNTLQRLGLQPASRAGRAWDERRAGALKLLRKQAYVLAVQLLPAVIVILASPWLPFAG